MQIPGVHGGGMIRDEIDSCIMCSCQNWRPPAKKQEEARGGGRISESMD